MAIQTERPFRVKTSLGEDALLLDSFRGVERVSAPFHYVVRVLADDPSLDMKSLLYKPLVLSMNLDEGEDQARRQQDQGGKAGPAGGGQQAGGWSGASGHEAMVRRRSWRR